MKISRRLPAFTLVELMVVVGIIGVLMGILLPTVNRVRQRGMAVQCASNLRQIAVGFRMYVDGNKSVAPPARMPMIPGSRNLYDLGQGPQYRPRWYEVLGAFNKAYAFETPSPANDDDREITNPLYLCPAVPDWKNARNYVYGYNYQFLGNARKKANGKWINWPVNVSRIKMAETVLAADSMGTAAGHATQLRRAYQGNGGRDQNAWGNHGYNMDPPRLEEDSDYCEWRHRSPHDRSGPDPRHSARVNVAYCDGHVAAETPEDIGYVVKPSGAFATDAAKSVNNKFSGSGRDDKPPSID